MIRQDAERLVDLLARSKAVWMVPELLNLAVEAESPNQASKVVLAHPDGTRKKAKAANLLARAYKDFPKETVGACVRFAQVCCHESSGLKLRRIADLLTPED
jgi:hypothetical protein